MTTGVSVSILLMIFAMRLEYMKSHAIDLLLKMYTADVTLIEVKLIWLKNNG